MSYYRIDQQFFTVVNNVWYPGVKIYRDRLQDDEEVAKAIAIGGLPGDIHITKVGPFGLVEESLPVDSWLRRRTESSKIQAGDQDRLNVYACTRRDISGAVLVAAPNTEVALQVYLRNVIDRPDAADAVQVQGVYAMGNPRSIALFDSRLYHVR